MPITFKAHDAAKKQGQHMPWACSKCTLNNVASARHCEACNAPRPGGGPPPEPVIETAAPEPEPAFAASTLGAKPAKFNFLSPMSKLFPGPSNQVRIGQRLPPIQPKAVTPEEDGKAAEPFSSYAGHHGRHCRRDCPRSGHHAPSLPLYATVTTVTTVTTITTFWNPTSTSDTGGRWQGCRAVFIVRWRSWKRRSSKRSRWRPPTRRSNSISLHLGLLRAQHGLVDTLLGRRDRRHRGCVRSGPPIHQPANVLQRDDPLQPIRRPSPPDDAGRRQQA